MKTWSECQAEFAANLDAYRQGVGRWEAGPGYNYVRELDGIDVLCVFESNLGRSGGLAEYSRFRVVGQRQAARRDVSRSPTWCNQAVGLWTFGMLGQDLDAFDGREHNANGIIQRLRAGEYDRGAVTWERVPHESAIAYAADGGCVVVAALVPNGIGHVAVLQPDGRTSQAGAKTGIDIPIDVGFGRALAGQVEFWAGTINAPDGDDDES